MNELVLRSLLAELDEFGEELVDPDGAVVESIGLIPSVFITFICSSLLRFVRRGMLATPSNAQIDSSR
jgi:hypothetical protein